MVATSAPPRREVGGPLEIAAYDRADRDHATAFQRGLWYDDKAANRAVNFIEGFIRHHQGEWAGRPFLLEPWQDFIVSELFGWKRADGTRRFRHAFVEVPRKNGKSELAAAIGNLLTFADGEFEGQVYSSATKKDQARIVWNMAKRQVETSPYLRDHATIFRNSIFEKRHNGIFEPLAADHQTLDGLNPHGNIIDELHAHKTRDVYDVMVTAMGARRQPLTFIITTAGIYEPESIGFEQHTRAINVLEGAFEADDFFAFIACADKDDDWTQEATWIKANPNYGVSVKPDYLRSQAELAEQSPSFVNTFLRLHLGVWTNQVERWLDLTAWNECNLEADDADLATVPCFGGLDLSTTTDLTCLVLAFPDDQGMVDLRCWFWCPEESIRLRSLRDRVPYDTWERDGFITLTEGNVVDYDAVRRDLNEIAQRYYIGPIGFDPWNATQLITQLQGDGFDMVPVRQGYASLSGPSKEFEKLVMSRKLAHGGHPILRWQAANVAKAEDPAGNIKPAKDKSFEKIDGIVAAIMAIDQSTRNPTPEGSGLSIV